MYRIRCLSIAILVACADQAVKYVVAHTLSVGQSFPVIGKYLYITYVLNNGAAFSLFREHKWLLVMMAALFLVAAAYYLPRAEKFGHLMTAGLALMIGGTLGNLVDRLSYGYVIDYFDLRFWPVFNVADCAICAGAALVALVVMRSENKRERNNEKTPVSG